MAKSGTKSSEEGVGVGRMRGWIQVGSVRVGAMKINVFNNFFFK